MTRRPSIALMAAVLLLAQARDALAQRGTFRLTDMAGARVRSISFFLVGFLACAWAFQRIWNGARVDFPRLPRLSYRRAVGIIALWGMLFLLILTMISGARELTMPWDWRNEGFTYDLDAPPKPTEPTPIDPGRRGQPFPVWGPPDVRRRLGQVHQEQHQSRGPQELGDAGRGRTDSRRCILT